MFDFLSKIFKRHSLSRRDKLSLKEFFGVKVYNKLFDLYEQKIIDSVELVTITPPAASILVEEDVLSLLKDGFFEKEELLSITAEASTALTNPKVRSILKDGVISKDFVLSLNRTGLKALNARNVIQLLLEGLLSPSCLPHLSHASLSVLDDKILPLLHDNILDIDFLLNINERVAIGLRGDGVKELLRLGYLKQQDLLLLSDNAFKLLQCSEVVAVLIEKPDLITKEELFIQSESNYLKLQKTLAIDDI